jgi:hypothetical protein
MTRAPLAALAVMLTVAGLARVAQPKSKPKAEVEACPANPAPPAAGLGSPDPFRSPDAKAVELNAAGKAPYRQGKWDEARAQYRAAEAADPEFLAPKLNVACSFVRQERFADATAEVVSLLGRAYVPWAREILDAADLGALKVRPEMKEIDAAMAASAARWGEGVRMGLAFIARQRPPLHVPDGPGVFILNPHQEIWAYVPRTERYLQVTAEDGHVVAMSPTSDGSKLIYVTAEKLVRGAKPDDVALRGVAVREVMLASMALSPPARVPGDVRRLAIYYPSAVIGIGQENEELLTLSAEGTLEPIEIMGKLGAPLVTLTGRGVAPGGERRFGGCCVGRQTKDPKGTPTLEVGVIGGKLSPIKANLGAGLLGLPLP